MSGVTTKETQLFFSIAVADEITMSPRHVWDAFARLTGKIFNYSRRLNSIYVMERFNGKTVCAVNGECFSIHMYVHIHICISKHVRIELINSSLIFISNIQNHKVPPNRTSVTPKKGDTSKPIKYSVHYSSKS